MVASGFGLSAFFFSTFAHTLFPGHTSALLLVLALGASFPMLLGFFIIRPSHHSSQNLYESIPASESQLSIVEQWDTFSPVEATSEQEAVAHVRETARMRGESGARRSRNLGEEDTAFLLTDGVSSYRGRSRNATRMALEIPGPASRDREHVSLQRSFVNTMANLDEPEVDIHGMALFKTLDFWLMFSILSLRMF